MKFKLMLGYSCNMSCSYCYIKNNLCNDKNMSYEVIDKFLERFNKLDGTHSITFFGGEPLLYADKIKYIMNNIPKRTRLSITTNGKLRNVFHELERYWGSSIPNLLSNKENKDYRKLNNESSFRWVVTHENMHELTDGMVEFLIKEYKDRIGFHYDLTEKWELEDVEFMENIQTKLKSVLGLNFKMYLPVNLNTKFSCYGEGECVINYNGDYLGCHRVPNSTFGNVFENELQESQIDDCIYYNETHLNNLYSYGNYKFKSALLFKCD